MTASALPDDPDHNAYLVPDEPNFVDVPKLHFVDVDLSRVLAIDEYRVLWP